MDEQILLGVEDELIAILVEVDPGDGVLEVHSSEGANPPVAVRIVHHHVVHAVLVGAQHQKTTVRVASTRTDHRFSPRLYQLHLHLLVKFKGTLEDAQQLVPQRVDCNRPRTLMDGVFVLLFYVLDIAVVDDMRASEAEYF